MKTYTSNSSEETKKIAFDLAKKFKSGIIALTGELGSGKTTFAQGFAKGLEIREKIISPTFVLIRQHPIPKLKKVLFHIDLYRLETVDVKILGIDEILKSHNNIVLIEWAEKIESLLPKETTWINFEVVNENRSIVIKSIR